MHLTRMKSAGQGTVLLKEEKSVKFEESLGHLGTLDQHLLNLNEDLLKKLIQDFAFLTCFYVMSKLFVLKAHFE